MKRRAPHRRSCDGWLAALVALAILGCGSRDAPRPAAAPALIPVSFERVSFALDPRVAASARPMRVEACRLENPTDKPDGIAPAHVAFHLGPSTGPTRPCAVPDFERAGLYVFSAHDFRRDLASARAQLHELALLLRARAYQPGRPVPFVPFVDASFAVAGRPAFVNFSAGTGVLFLVELSIEPDTLGDDLVFLFQGLSLDGERYVLGIFPVESSPSVPAFAIDPQAPYHELAAAFETYRRDVASKLGAARDDTFSPRPSWLLAMLSSLRI
jgi:hypothetical protein